MCGCELDCLVGWMVGGYWVIGGLVLVVCLIGCFVCRLGGSLGRTVRASVGQSLVWLDD